MLLSQLQFGSLFLHAGCVYVAMSPSRDYVRVKRLGVLTAKRTMKPALGNPTLFAKDTEVEHTQLAALKAPALC